MANSIVLTEDYVYLVASDANAVMAAEEVFDDGWYGRLQSSNGGKQLLGGCNGYDVRVDLSDPKKLRSSCDCLSNKRHCKHALAILMLAIRSPELFEQADSADARSGVVEPAAAPANLEDALYCSILDEPEDDGLRLIYADWLEDNGKHERAEFIRVQMELARIDEADPRGRSLRAREKKLWSAHRNEWLAGVPAHLLLGRGRPGMDFQKGFLEELNGPVKSWAGCWEELFARFPIYRIRVTGPLRWKEAGMLAMTHQMSQVRILSVDEEKLVEPSETLPILFGTPHFSSLRRVELGRNRITTRDAALLAGEPELHGITELVLADNEIGPKGAESLAGIPWRNGLRELSLANNPIGDVGAKALARSPHLDGIERLDLSGVVLGRGAARLLRERFGTRVVVE